MSDKVMEGYLNPDGTGEGNWAAPTQGSTPRPQPHDPPPWIRPWEAMNLHAPGTDDVLQWQENLDYACYAVNRIEAIEAALVEAEKLLTQWVLAAHPVFGITRDRPLLKTKQWLAAHGAGEGE